MNTFLPPYQSRWKTRAESDDAPVTFTLGYPVMFHWAVLAGASGLLLFSAIYHILPFLALAVFLLIFGSLNWLWSKRSLRGVSCALGLAQGRAFPEEGIELTLDVSNRKWLPLFWLEIQCELPFKLIHGRAKSSSPYVKERLRWTTTLLGSQRITWKHHFICKARGEYRIGPVRLRSGDVLGCFPREAIFPNFVELLVYPQIVWVDKLSLPLRQLVGEVGAPRSIYEDVNRPVGTRDYRHDDPFTRIHWKASARLGTLQAKHYDSTSGLSLLLLDVHSFCQGNDGHEDAFETGVSIAASLAYKAHREKAPVGLIANSVPEIHIPISSGQNQLMRILETLARINLESRWPLYQHLDQSSYILPLGVTPIIITSSISPAVASLSRKFCVSGVSPVLICCSEQMPAQVCGTVPFIPIHSVGNLS